MPKFTAADLQRQLDAAIDLIVFLIDREVAERARGGHAAQTPRERQATIASLLKKMPLIEDRKPDTALVLEAVVERFLSRGRTH